MSGALQTWLEFNYRRFSAVLSDSSKKASLGAAMAALPPSEMDVAVAADSQDGEGERPSEAEAQIVCY